MIGALIAHDKNDVKVENVAGDIISAVRDFRKAHYGDDSEDQVLIGAVLDLNNGSCEHDLQFFISRAANSYKLDEVSSIVYEDQPVKEVWEKGCIVRCELPLKLPLYYASDNPKGEPQALSPPLSLSFVLNIFVYATKFMFLRCQLIMYLSCCFLLSCGRCIQTSYYSCRKKT